MAKRSPFQHTAADGRAALDLLRSFVTKYRDAVENDLEINGPEAVDDLTKLWADADVLLRKPARKR